MACLDKRVRWLSAMFVFAAACLLAVLFRTTDFVFDNVQESESFTTVNPGLIQGFEIIPFLERDQTPTAPRRNKNIYFPELGNISAIRRRIGNGAASYGFPTHIEKLFSFNGKYQFSKIFCTLKRKKTINIAIMGGSASQESCDKHRGPSYVKLWENTLKEFFPLQEINLFNAAQGGTDSLYASILMESILPPAPIDILVWEFAINDYLGGTSGFPERNLIDMQLLVDIWFHRLLMHTNGHPPPIIMLYLWDAHQSKTPGRPVEVHALQAQLPIIQQYKNIGLDITIINIGGSIHKYNPVRKTDPLQWQHLVDYHHPSCGCAQFIVDALMLSVLEPLVGCSNKNIFAERRRINKRRKALNAPKAGEVQQLYKAGIISSQHQWAPHFGIMPMNFSIEHPHIELNGAAKVNPLRTDRKFSYDIPYCKSNNSLVMKFGPYHDLSAVAFSVGGGFYLANLIRNVGLMFSVNDEKNMSLLSLSNIWWRDFDKYQLIQYIYQLKQDERLRQIRICLTSNSHAMWEEARWNRPQLNFIIFLRNH